MIETRKNNVKIIVTISATTTTTTSHLTEPKQYIFSLWEANVEMTHIVTITIKMLNYGLIIRRLLNMCFKMDNDATRLSSTTGRSSECARLNGPSRPAPGRLSLMLVFSKIIYIWKNHQIGFLSCQQRLYRFYLEIDSLSMRPCSSTLGPIWRLSGFRVPASTWSSGAELIIEAKFREPWEKSGWTLLNLFWRVMPPLKCFRWLAAYV